MKAARWALLTLSLALIAAGVWLDEPTAQMMNAVMICLACIGVG